MTEKDKKYLEQINANIEKSGCHIIQVMADENNPEFSYTIGLYQRFNHPEVIIIGLKNTLSAILLNNMAYEIERGRNFVNGEYHEGILDDFVCYFGEVPKSEYKDHVGWAMWFYGYEDFPLMQCVPPTVEGKFPWDKDFPEDAEFYLKVITNPPKEH